MIRYLTAEEKDQTKALWKEAFPEDSKSFTDYYYEEKTKDNRILVNEDEESGKILAMMHLNPYRICMGTEIRTLYYIVGVATKTEERHKGFMRELMAAMFEDQYHEKVPFTFLMPASPDIYRPFGFTYIYDQIFTELKNGCDIRKEKLADCGLTEAERIAEFSRRWLEKRYDVYAVRDPYYMERFIRELRSENGEQYLLYKGVDLVGIQSFWGLEKREQRELLCDEEYTQEKKPAEPAIMARIMHLQEFVKAIHLREDWIKSSGEFKLRIHDPLIPENDGTWLWIMNRESSYMEKLENEETADIPEMTIEEFAAWIFSYTGRDKAAIPSADLDAAIQPFMRVFLDEVV